MTKTEIFIEKSVSKHNNKYDYSLVEYINSTTKVKIICKEHGLFEQTPNHHIQRGQGCRKCGDIRLSISKTSNTEVFIEKSKKIHGNKYDYSKSVYKTAILKIDIICKEHNELFTITPNAHLNGMGCPLCSGSRLNTDIFIQRSIEIHKDKYDYSLVEYKHSQKYVKIICKKHGEFLQKPNEHLKGKGCINCISLDTDIFIEKSTILHKDKYDYLYVDYVNTHKKVKIFCKKHNEIFEISPNRHLSGQGCSYCSGMKLNNDIFIEKSKLIHGNIFIYNKLNYINSSTKVTLTCKKHGNFEISPNNHLSKNQGCVKCVGKVSKGEIFIKEFVEKRNINYIHQHIFEDCKYKKKLRFDFYLPEKNICIEYDGEQHYKPVVVFGGLNGFEKTIIRDNIKDEYCKNNNIKMIRIPYYNINKIDSILENLN